MNKKHPPHLAVRFFRWYCNPRLEEQILGDLEEQFMEDCEAHGLVRARIRFVWNVLRFFRRGIIKPVRKSQKLNQYDMFKHHITLALRGFKRFKTSFAINLLGLSTGLACTLLIYLWVHDEWNMDKFHENGDRLYQVLHNMNNEGESETIPETPALLGEALLEEFPVVEEMVSMVPVGSYGSEGIMEYGGKQLKTMEQYASPAYFKFFSFPLKLGSSADVLTEKNSVVISEDFANKLFGKEVDPRGKEIIWYNFGEKKIAIVTGVFETLTTRTSEQFDAVFTLESFLDRFPHVREWRNADPSTYIQLSKEASSEEFQEQIKDYLRKKREGTKNTLLLQKYSDRYLYGKYENGTPIPGRMQYIKLFSTIAILVLFIACINFMNLSTARASRRLKEIGIKKSLGVSRRSLVTQFFTETFLLTFISILTAYIIASIVLPGFNNLTSKDLAIELNRELIVFSLALLLITTLLAGSYPALYLSRFEPIAILKGKLSGTIGDLWARKGLVILQYSASAILITSVWVVSSQVKFMENKNLGFDKEQVIYFNADGRLNDQSKIFVEEVKKIPGVRNAAGFSHDLLGDAGSTSGLKWEGKDPENRTRFGNLEIGYGLIETFGMEIVKGRSFSPEFGDEGANIILNEKAVEATGFEDPVGKTVLLWGKRRKVIGVVKNFHFESLHEEIKPCFLQVYENAHSTIVIRVSPGNEMETLERIEDLYHEYNPALTFNFQFFDQEYDALYRSEQQVASLSSYFAGIAIMVSCLGLFGLVAFTAEKKQKEIGIRKVLGASVANLVLLLSSDFARIIAVAVLISVPVSYWMLNRWLDSFVYRIELHAWFFAGSGLVALGIAMITMSAQTIRAAAANPVNSLKDE